MKKYLDNIANLILAIGLLFTLIGTVMVVLRTVSKRRAVKAAETQLFADL